MKKSKDKQASIKQKVKHALITAAPFEAESIMVDVFGEEIPSIAEFAGDLIGGQIINRSSLYVDAIYSTFENNQMAREFDEGVRTGRRVSEGDGDVCDGCDMAATSEYIPLEDIEEIGSQECGGRCRCEIEFGDEDSPFRTSDLFQGVVSGQEQFGGDIGLE